jgi:hypothetical protein
MVQYIDVNCDFLFVGYVSVIDTFCPGRQKVSKKRPAVLLRRIPATRFAEFFTSLIFV